MTYVLDVYGAKSLKSYNAIGCHILGFLRQHVQHALSLPRPLNLRVKKENLQMPAASMKKLDLYLRKELALLMKAKYNKRSRQFLSKFFGKSFSFWGNWQLLFLFL